ncbi:ABC transporter permease [Dyella choica]|uniref:FtsX-like permease family protein n=1 Tax=Dyella choica TaxID=1927959 RepID=A0A3S0PJM0_9GAMM|nr:FtsX-like permease family protein [Dyella choica]RUL71432.1 FtsX-like permease family protein [Dyella choica]
MQIKPILTAMRHHKAGTILIAFQIALTLAIVCNALFIIQQRVTRVMRPSGVEEANLFAIDNQWADSASVQNVGAQIRADLTALRQLGSVQDAYATNSFPLRGWGWDNYVRLRPDQVHRTSDSAIFFTDDHTLATLGVKLIEGRNFTSSEAHDVSIKTLAAWPEIIISKDLAKKTFPDGHAVGKPLYVNSDASPSVVVGVTDTLQSHMTDSDITPFAYDAVLVPGYLLQGMTRYVIRARPGQLQAAMRDAKRALVTQSRMRIIDPKDGVRTFAQVRAKAYERDYGMAMLMGIVSVVLLAITAAGIVGLTSFWVGQRRKQIGIRRALGATRADILSYFLTENAMIGGCGVIVGILLALGINLWMVMRFEMAHLSGLYVLIAAAILLLLGQGAVLAPALRASRVSPVEATRPA